MIQMPDVPAIADQGLYSFLQAVRRGIQSAATGETDAFIDITSLVVDFEGKGDGASLNDAAIVAAEADPTTSVYVGRGEFKTNLAKTALTKRYFGDGVILAGTDALPPRFSYMASKPNTNPVQGQAGWFRGDQRFTDGGEWKIIGPNVRTYDLSGRYYESNTIPHHGWLDVESGSSGGQAYLIFGASAGATTITLQNSASPEWVGKQLQFAQTLGGAAVETRTVQSVSGNTVTLTQPLTGTYVWLPLSGLHPNIRFALRTWNGMYYTRVRARAGGDTYGAIARMEMSYQPKPTELTHTFLAATAGQFGGETNFTTPRCQLSATISNPASLTVAVTAINTTDWVGKRIVFRDYYGGPPLLYRTVVSATSASLTLDLAPGTAYGKHTWIMVDNDGTYTTGWESAYYDQGADVAVIGQVDSFIRFNDRAANGGRVWLGTRFQSAGSRPSDAAHVVAGFWRTGLDTSLAFLKDSSFLTSGASAGATLINVNSTNGAKVGDEIVITYANPDATNPGVTGGTQFVYSGTIQAVNTFDITVSPALTATFPAGSYVEYPEGGAIIAAAFGQKVVWNCTGVNTARGADPNNVFGPLYGNVQGDIETGTETDGVTDYWYTRFNGKGHSGATARIRLRPTSFQCNVDFQCGQVISAAKDLVTNDYSGAPGFSGAVIFSAGSGNEIRFNPTAGNFEFYKGGVLSHSI